MTDQSVSVLVPACARHGLIFLRHCRYDNPLEALLSSDLDFALVMTVTAKKTPDSTSVFARMLGSLCSPASRRSPDPGPGP